MEALYLLLAAALVAATYVLGAVCAHLLERKS